MAKSRNRKSQKQKTNKRNEKQAREMMHSGKRRANMEQNLEIFKQVLKEFAEEAKEKKEDI